MFLKNQSFSSEITIICLSHMRKEELSIDSIFKLEKTITR